MRLLVADNYPCNTCEVKYCRQNCAKFNIWLDTVIEAEPVVHGEWGEYESPYGFPSLSGFPCGVCGMHQTDIRGLYYCPNCGAKMDGGKKDEKNV